MERRPCNPNIENTDACTIYRKIGKCATNIHHKYHPRRSYRTEIEKKFREHPDNKEEICMDIHRIKHIQEDAPEKPSRDEMLEFLK